jgi:acetyl/propionyl-CoA carboxylase alpha subunit
VAAITNVLVANRGEIAARVFRTCRRLGIGTVAVATREDEGAYHTRQADRTVGIASYLDPAAVVGAARTAGADAVHPGYGFLAESARLAAAVEEAGIVWIGPPAAALRLAGDKLEARGLAAAAGVPVLVSGSPEDVGFPLLVKAAGGGGGRGMRVVRGPEGLDAALEAARREAESAFGDGTVYLERLLERARHVEVQILADSHGAVGSLGERECSIQRRHQKLLEESPSPALDEPLPARLAKDAVAVARAAGYVGAGTVEFLLRGGDHVFLELNARLQVEHPVTELVTGVDLVERQLRIAAGEPLGVLPGPSGHAAEVRLYAEHPVTFLPQTGRIERLVLPKGVRIDAGVEEGDAVPAAYDPLLAKLIARGESRDEAFDLLAEALAATEVGGVTTNLPLLRWLVDHPEVRAGGATTSFLEEHPPLARLRRTDERWVGGWRLNLPAAEPSPPPAEEAPAATAGTAGDVRAPMPGTVVGVLVGEGDRVAPREPLVLLEAMKMETPLASPFEARVRRVHVAEGDRVVAGALLVELE